jgi:hypothetical protein
MTAVKLIGGIRMKNIELHKSNLLLAYLPYEISEALDGEFTRSY